MAELPARSPFEGLGLPMTLGDCTLSTLPEVPRWSLAPFRGREAEVATALGSLPPPGGSTERSTGRVLWAGMGLWLVEGAPPELAGLAAAADQSDAWVGLALAGEAAAQVLARLAPIDAEALAAGEVGRTVLRHVPCVLIAAEAGFDLLVPRSFLPTAVADIVEAMRAVAGRAALRG